MGGSGSAKGGTALARNVLGVPGVVFLVLAAVAPLTGMVVIAAIGIAVGNGGGMVAAFLLATAVLLLFAVGYAQMSRVLTSAGGLALLFAANAFIGFEATALFGEEAREPTRTIPRATYIAICFIGVFAAFTTWAVVSAIGVEQAQRVATAHLTTGDLVFSVSQEYLGDPLTKAMMLLLVVSLFAALLALHNSATRYLYALGRVGVLPRRLGRTRAGNGSPRNAAVAQLTFASAVALVYWAFGLDPVAVLTASMTGFGTLGILTLQLFAAVAIVVHFRRVADPRYWPTLVAPGLGVLGLLLIVVLAIHNFSALAGSDNPVIGRLPWLLPVVALAGLAVAAWLRRHRPDVYRALRTDLERQPTPREGTT